MSDCFLNIHQRIAPRSIMSSCHMNNTIASAQAHPQRDEGACCAEPARGTEINGSPAQLPYGPALPRPVTRIRSVRQPSHQHSLVHSGVSCDQHRRSLLRQVFLASLPYTYGVFQPSQLKAPHMPDEATLAEPEAICVSDESVLAAKESSDLAAQESTRDASAVADAQPAEASNAAPSDGKATAAGAKIDELEVPEGIETWPDEKPAISKEDEDRLLKVCHQCIGYDSAYEWHDDASSANF